jgi:hypothetical protein
MAARPGGTAGRCPACDRHSSGDAGVLPAADIEVFTTTTTFQIMQWLRSTAGPADQATLIATRRGRPGAGPGAGLGFCAPGSTRPGTLR